MNCWRRRPPLPPWAGELGAGTWAELLLKYVLSHPAVTCAIPGTTSVANLETNLRAASGVLPDAAMRARMEAFWDSLEDRGEPAPVGEVDT